MAFTIPDDELGTVSKLSNYPNRIERLKAATLKGRFDADAKTVMGALKRLIQELGLATAARNVGFEKTTAVNADNVQDAIENVQSQIAGVSQGGIADGAVTAEKIADGAVGTAAIADDAVTAGKLAMSAVDTDAIKWGAVDEYRLKDAAVTEAKLANGSVTESKIGYYAVTEKKIASGAVTGEKIADRTINSAKMGDASVTERALCDGAVTNEKIARGAVTAEKVAYKAMRTAVDISATVASPGNACTSYGGLYMHAHSIGLMFFSLTLKGLAAADVGKTVTVSFSGGEDYQRPGVSVGPDHALRDLNVSSLTARIVYRDSDQNIVQASALAYFTEAGQLAVQIPTGVVAGRNCEIFASGWYMA